MSTKFSFRDILIFLFDFFSISLMINSPNILIGYGLVIPAMILSIMLLRPIKGALIFLLAHILGFIYLTYTESMFMTVSLLSLIIRSLVLFIVAYYYEKGYLKGITLPSALIVILDNILAYSISFIILWS